MVESRSRQGATHPRAPRAYEKAPVAKPDGAGPPGAAIGLTQMERSLCSRDKASR